MSRQRKKKSNRPAEGVAPAASETAAPVPAVDAVAEGGGEMNASEGVEMAQAAPVAAVESERESAAATEEDAVVGQAGAAETSHAAEPAEAHDVKETVAAAAPASLGTRLRRARETLRMSAADVGSRLHIPVQIIHTLEADQFDRIGYGIYLRGYLNNYARLVGVPTILVDTVVRERDHAPQLVTSGTISHSRYLYQRYSVSALYLILTGVIVVPAVLLAMRAGMQPTASDLAPLEPPTISTPAPEPASGQSATPQGGSPATGPAAGTKAATTTEGSETEAPLVASLAPFSALGHREAATPRSESAPDAASGAHTLKLSLSEKSWVEIVTTSGEKLEYGLLPAGTSRTYRSAEGLDVRLGNSNGAEIEIDGRSRDLAPFRRANVAHFRLSRDGEPAAHGDG